MPSRSHPGVSLGSSPGARGLRRRALAVCGTFLLLLGLVPGAALATGLPPVANNQSDTTPSKPLQIFLEASDPEFDGLTYIIVSAPSHGTLTACSSGFCTYTGTAGYLGPDSFTWKANDGTSDSNVATFSITVVENEPPVANDQSETTPSKPLQIVLEASDPEFDDLTYTIVSAPSHGTLTACSSGFCTYTGTAGYLGPDSFTWKANDGTSDSNVATFSITVVENEPPVANDQSETVAQNSPTTINLDANDPDFDTLAYTIISGPSHGSLDDCSSGFCTYTPNAGYLGPDSLTWKANDGSHDSNVATFSITVTPPCYPARCIDNGTILLAVNPEGELNATDGSGSPAGQGDVGLDFIPTDHDATSPGCLCEGWGVADAASGITGYANVSTDGGAVNLDLQSFNVTASTAISVVTIDDAIRVTHDYHPTPKTPNLYEVTVTIENISGHALGDIRYRRVMDWDIEPTAFREFVTIQGGNAVNLLFDSDQGFATANPLGGPADLGNTGDFVDAGPADHGALFDFGFGSLAAGASKSFNIFYGGAATEVAANQAINAVGAEVYSLGEPSTPDGPTLGTPNTFIFAFGSVGGAPIFSPIAVDDSLNTPVGTPGSINVLANDTDPDHDPLTVTTPTPTAAHGTVSCTAAGICTYTPAAGYVGPDSFDYTITDGNGGFDTATVSVTVFQPNRPPVGNPDSYTTPQDTTLIVPAATGVLANDTDPDGNALTASKVGDPSHGAVVLNADGSFAYTPVAGYSGPNSFTYQVSDGTVSVGPITVSIEVIPPVPAHLTLAKSVDNTGGGTAAATAWTLTASGPTPLSGHTGDPAITDAAVGAGTYLLAETGGPAGYSPSGWSCTGGGTLTGASLVLAAGETVSCTITNTFIPPVPAHLTLAKSVDNTGGGTAAATAWTLTASGPTPLSGHTGDPAITDAAVGAGTYLLAETGGPAGYSPSGWSCTGGGTLTGASLVLAAGETVSCTITNTFIPPVPAHLTLAKSVDNTGGGTAAATAWTLTASGPTPLSGHTGDPAITDAAVGAGTYLLAETGGPAGYSPSGWSCTGGGTLTGASLVLAAGETVSCTITNTFIPPVPAHLTLAKSVDNTGGGTAAATAWTLTASGPTPLSGHTGDPAITDAAVGAGTYLLAETGGPAGYSPSGWSCTGGGTLTGASLVLAAGETVSCTITNTFIPPVPAHLTLAKSVDNTGGGTAAATAWTLTASGPTPLSGHTGDPAITDAAVGAGTYLLAETGGPAGYSPSGWSCTGGGTLTGASLVLAAGETVSCTITNTFIPPVATGCNRVGKVNGDQEIKIDTGHGKATIHIKVQAHCHLDKKTGKLYIDHAKVRVTLDKGGRLIDAKTDKKGKHNDITGLIFLGSDDALVSGSWKGTPFVVTLHDGGKHHERDTMRVQYDVFDSSVLGGAKPNVKIDHH